VTVRLAPDPAVRRRLQAVAAGREPADTVLAGGAVLDVFTEEILEGWGLALAAGRVAYAGPDAAERAGPETELIDLAGDLVAPGLIEGHTHLTRIGMAETVRLQLVAGVTTTVLEASELAYVTGLDGFKEYLAEAATMPGRVLVPVPPLVGLDPVHDARLAPAAEWVAMLDHPLVPGVGEVYWADLLRGHPRSEALIAGALERGLVVEGHGAGARPPVLNQLAAAGFASDHEGISAEDTLERLRLGYQTMAREGATRRDLEAIGELWQKGGVDLGRLSLVSDGIEPEELAGGSSLNRVVERARELGLPLARAVRLATRNAAERLGLGRWLGGLGPGMLADLVVTPRGRFQPRLVLVGGRRPVVAEPRPYPEWMLSSMRLDRLNTALLSHPGRGRWRAIQLTSPTVTRELETDGEGALVLTALDRIQGQRGFRGLLSGFGLQGGAVALSSGWESPCLVAAGDRPEDMAIALRRVADMQGGAAVAARGSVLADWRAEVGGLHSQATASEVISRSAAVQGALRELGCPWPNPLLSLETLTTPAIPFLRLSAEGYVRIKDGSPAGLDM